MLTKQEEDFIDYWEKNRLQKKKVLKQLSIGLPFGVLLVIAIFLNFFSGWDKRAEMVASEDRSVVLVLLIAAILIVAFIVIFSVRHQWDLHEQQYKELLAKRDSRDLPQ
jgi:sterol desaturase/sphingolipid hydroxylase (fatty acid hydroxylase superfamily)